MFRYIKYAVFFIGFVQAAADMSEELKPLLTQDTLVIRKELKNGLSSVRTLEVRSRTECGTPLEISERIHAECSTCFKKKTRGFCDCNRADQVSVENMRESEPVPVREPLRPNRFAQALVACISCPQALCFACSTDEYLQERFVPNSCHERYVDPFVLPPENKESVCCYYTMHFFPCCAPQVESDSSYQLN